MPRICYVPKTFSPEHQAIIGQANTIIDGYLRQGYRLTLRQLYYQFVARGLIANKVQEYKRLGGIVNDARLAGLIDWTAIEDRTRNLETIPSWGSPGGIIDAAARSYNEDVWRDQPVRIEVWVEKEALAGIFDRACKAWDLPYLSCRGYTSQSEMWAASQRLLAYVKGGQKVAILHFGDHDPSGIDMSRDIVDRLRIFGVDLSFERLALNMDQVEEHKPPPNPAKLTDSRCTGYIKLYGDQSWELDALEPAYLANLVEGGVRAVMDENRFTAARQRVERRRLTLTKAANRWDEVADYLDTHEEA